MYTEKEKLSLLNSVLKRDIKISIEYLKSDKSSNFHLGSFDNFIYETNFHDYNKFNKTMIFDEYNNMMELIRGLKTEYFETKDSYIPPIRKKHIVSYLNNYSSSAQGNFNGNYLSKVSSVYASNWKNIANLKGININQELYSIATLNSELQELNNISILTEEIKDVANKLSDLMDNFVPDDSDPRGLPSNYFKIHDELKYIFSDDTKLINQVEMSCCSELFKKYPIFDIFSEMNDIFRKIQDKFIEAGVDLSMAQSYIRSFNDTELKDNKNIINFLNQKTNENPNIKFTLEMSKSQKYSECIVFNDNSILVKDNNDTLKFIVDDLEASTIIKDVYKSFIDFKLRKKPTIAKLFNDMLVANNYDIDRAVITMDTYLNNENILKSSGFDILTSNTLQSDPDEIYYIKNNIPYLESLDDLMNKFILDHKAKQYAESIVSNKYLPLYNDHTYSILKEIYELGIDQSILQNSIGKKIAAFHNSEDLNNGLTKMLNSFNDFNLEAIKLKADSSNINITLESEDLIVLEIDSFEQSSRLGSASWCISRDKHYFDSYTGNGNKQYFIYDFTKSSKDPESMIGMTLSNDGEFSTAHLKDDEYTPINNQLKTIQIGIILNNPDSFPELSDSHKDAYAEYYNKDGNIKSEYRSLFRP